MDDLTEKVEEKDSAEKIKVRSPTTIFLILHRAKGGFPSYDIYCKLP